MRRLRQSTFFLLILFLLVVRGLPAAAQSPAPLRFKDQVIVTAGRTEGSLDRVPAAVTLLDEADIAASPAQDIPSLLRQAGVHVVDVTGNRRSYRVDLRGFGATASSNVLVLVDGRRVNQPDLGGTDWFQIPLDRVERIELIRGSGGAVPFGDNATAGVINIITKGGTDDDRRVALKAGAFSTLTPEASARGTRGHVSYSAFGRYHQSDGHRENAQTKGGDLGGEVTLRPAGVFEFGLSTGYHGDKTGLPGALTETDLDQGIDPSESVTPDDFADVDDVYVMATPRATLGPHGSVLADISVRQRDSVFFSSFSGGEFTGETGTRTLAVSPKVTLQHTLGATPNRLVAGFDLANAKQDIRNSIAFGGPASVGLFTLEKASRGMYVHDELNAGAMTITAGYRYDVADYTFTPSTPAERGFHAHAGSVGAVVNLTEEASLFAGVSRSFRYPLLDELFDFFSNTIVTALEPQSSVDIEAGARIEAGTARIGLDLFRLVSRDEIFFNPVGESGFGANENLDGDSHRTGLELAVSALAGAVNIGGTYTLTDTAVDGGQYDSQQIPGVATHRMTLRGLVPLTDRVSFGVEGLYIGERRFEGDFAGTFGRQEGYFLLDARIAYRHDRARLFVDLKNVLGEEHTEYGVLGGFPTDRAFYPSPGRHALLGAEISF
jgi:iron complex outermembrane receptor protein